MALQYSTSIILGAPKTWMEYVDIIDYQTLKVYMDTNNNPCVVYACGPISLFFSFCVCVCGFNDMGYLFMKENTWILGF